MVRELLTDFELMVLLAILRVGDEAYGVPIAREIERTAGRAVAVPGLYVALDRLERRGAVTSSVGAPTPIRGGRAKRMFRVTAEGLKAIRLTKRAFVALWSGLPELQK